MTFLLKCRKGMMMMYLSSLQPLPRGVRCSRTASTLSRRGARLSTVEILPTPWLLLPFQRERLASSVLDTFIRDVNLLTTTLSVSSSVKVPPPARHSDAEEHVPGELQRPGQRSADRVQRLPRQRGESGRSSERPGRSGRHPRPQEDRPAARRTVARVLQHVQSARLQLGPVQQSPSGSR